MGGKQAMHSVVTTLLILATFNILPIKGLLTCPWCDKTIQQRLLQCVYTELMSRVELLKIPLEDIDNAKLTVESYSNSLIGLPFEVKKVSIDKKFVGEMANLITKNNFQDDQIIQNSICDLSGKCYSSVTGYDPDVVSQDVRALLKENIRKNTDSTGEDPPLKNVNPPFSPPFNPQFSPVSSFDGPSFVRVTSAENPLGLPPSTFFNPLFNPPPPFNPAGWSPVSPFDDPSSNQDPSDDSPDSPLQNDKDSQDKKKSKGSASPSSKSSSSQDSKPTDSDSSDSNRAKTPSPKKKDGNGKSDDDQPCDEKFKSVLYNRLIDDDRFSNLFAGLSISSTKSQVPRIMKNAFKKYGINQHFPEFSTFWGFESRTLTGKLKVEDLVEVCSKICKQILSGNNLLKGDCEEAGNKMADAILDTLPGDPPASSTKNKNQKEKDPGNLSFPDMHKKLSEIFGDDGSTDKNGDKAPLSQMLSQLESSDILDKLHGAAEDCLLPTGFDFPKYLNTMADVTVSIQKNHPDWSSDKCQKETLTACVAVLTKVLQDTKKDSNDDTKSKPSSIKLATTKDLLSSNSDTQPEIPNFDDISSDDLTDPITDSVPQLQQDLMNNNGKGPLNLPLSGNKPRPGDLNDGSIQPSNLSPGLSNTNIDNLANGNPQNVPLPQSGAKNVPPNLAPGPANPLSPGIQDVPSTDIPSGAPASLNSPLGNQLLPASPKDGLQQPPNLNPDYSDSNSPARNSGTDQGGNMGDYGDYDGDSSQGGPMGPNSDYQNFPPNQNFGSGGQNFNNPSLNFNGKFAGSANGPSFPHW